MIHIFCMVLLTALPYESFANEIKNTNAKDAVEIVADKLSEQKEEKTAVNQNQKMTILSQMRRSQRISLFLSPMTFKFQQVKK